MQICTIIHGIWSTSWWKPKVDYKFSPESTLSKKPQEVLSTEKRGGYLVEEVWEQLHPTQAFLKGFTIHIRSLENRTDLKTSQRPCLSQHFQIYYIQLISTEKWWILLVQETTAGTTDVTNCLNIGSMATSARKGKMEGERRSCWGTLSHSWPRPILDWIKYPLSLSLSPFQKDYLSETVKQYPLALQKIATILAAISKL